MYESAIFSIEYGSQNPFCRFFIRTVFHFDELSTYSQLQIPYYKVEMNHFNIPVLRLRPITDINTRQQLEKRLAYNNFASIQIEKVEFFRNNYENLM